MEIEFFVGYKDWSSYFSISVCTSLCIDVVRQYIKNLESAIPSFAIFCFVTNM